MANTHLASLLILMQVAVQMLNSEASKGYKHFFLKFVTRDHAVVIFLESSLYV